MYGKLFVSEVFGNTFQGEGRMIGTPSTFVRLGGCSLACVWCDTPYTWRFSAAKPHRDGRVYEKSREMRGVDVDDVFLAVTKYLAKHVVITGGEPLLQQAELVLLLDRLLVEGYTIEVETAGHVMPDDRLSPAIRYNVSPKLSNSGNRKEERHRPLVLVRFLELDSTFKFVARDPSDFNEIDSIVAEVAIPPNRVWIMPEGITVHDIEVHTQQVVDEALARGFNMTTRLQIIAFGNKRGT